MTQDLQGAVAANHVTLSWKLHDHENVVRRQLFECGYVTYLRADDQARQGFLQGGC